MAQTNPRYWFPAKRCGWGWGIPATWEGWMTLIAFITLVTAGAYLFPPRRDLAAYLAYVVALCVAFALVCWWKGESPRWRWEKGGGE